MMVAASDSSSNNKFEETHPQDGGRGDLLAAEQQRRCRVTEERDGDVTDRDVTATRMMALVSILRFGNESSGNGREELKA